MDAGCFAMTQSEYWSVTTVFLWIPVPLLSPMVCFALNKIRLVLTVVSIVFNMNWSDTEPIHSIASLLRYICPTTDPMGRFRHIAAWVLLFAVVLYVLPRDVVHAFAHGQEHTGTSTDDATVTETCALCEVGALLTELPDPLGVGALFMLVLALAIPSVTVVLSGSQEHALVRGPPLFG